MRRVQRRVDGDPRRGGARQARRHAARLPGRPRRRAALAPVAVARVAAAGGRAHRPHHRRRAAHSRCCASRAASSTARTAAGASTRSRADQSATSWLRCASGRTTFWRWAAAPPSAASPLRRRTPRSRRACSSRTAGPAGCSIREWRSRARPAGDQPQRLPRRRDDDDRDDERAGPGPRPRARRGGPPVDAEAVPVRSAASGAAAPRTRSATPATGASGRSSRSQGRCSGIARSTPVPPERRTIRMDLNRVEGDMEVRLELEGHTVTDAWCVGTMFRGFEQILVGRDPGDALVIAPRICGICTHVAALRGGLGARDRLRAPIAPNGTRIRNLCLMAESVMSDARHTLPDVRARLLQRGLPGPSAVRPRRGALRAAVQGPARRARPSSTRSGSSRSSSPSAASGRTRPT